MKSIFWKLPIVKSINQNDGLTLIEVLIATMIIVLFIGISLQALTIAALFQSRAKVQNDAINWIQEDLEKVRQKASVLAASPPPCKANNVNDGYAKLLNTNLPIIDTSNDTKQIAGLPYKISRQSSITLTPAISGSCKLNACYEVLSLKYQVNTPENVLIAEIETEVIPDAAFQCSI